MSRVVPPEVAAFRVGAEVVSVETSRRGVIESASLGPALSLSWGSVRWADGSRTWVWFHTLALVTPTEAAS